MDFAVTAERKGRMLAMLCRKKRQHYLLTEWKWSDIIKCVIYIYILKNLQNVTLFNLQVTGIRKKGTAYVVSMPENRFAYQIFMSRSTVKSTGFGLERRLLLYLCLPFRLELVIILACPASKFLNQFVNIVFLLAAQLLFCKHSCSDLGIRTNPSHSDGWMGMSVGTYLHTKPAALLEQPLTYCQPMQIKRLLCHTM